ncbi:hypothetical protein AWB75_01122 [Caballeronia catudaia]|uniref:O-antigen polymerase n=1 Tax=Caballeronia catudaia TaxID=1777136 RepID=A0A157ZS23_9BURK|nr:hypothetical protein [Caballeronia catudaia]SAK48318.1 hypothetical protein AWB75_01122 [Caballeronia catudaia]
MATHSATARPRIVKFIFWATVVVALLYSSYRYPFQINASGTSPTYTDTPPLLQAGKYLILVMACVVMALVAGGFYVSRRKLGFVALYLAISVYPLIHFMFDKDPKHLTFSIIAMVALFISVSVRRVDLKSVDAFMTFTLYASLIVDVIQVVLFFSVGRLPALAYSDSLSVRFGSFLDDPNGFGALLFLLLGYAYCSPRTMVNRLCLLGVILSIIFTQSLTAIGFLVLLFIVWGLVNYFKTSLIIVAMACLPLIFPFLFEGSRLGTRGLDAVLTSKQASSDDHFSSFTVDNLADPSVWVLGGDGYSSSESWWVGSFSNYGLIWTVSLLFMFCAFVWRLYVLSRKASSQRFRRLVWSTLLFSIYVVVASLNLPFPAVFPINFIFMLFLCLFMLEKLQDRVAENSGGARYG